LSPLECAWPVHLTDTPPESEWYATVAMIPAASPTCSAAPSRRRPRRRADDGQSIVEAAIILPAMIFLVLGILQLTMVQHARIMTEYAAFCAARAGIVFNADKKAMERAATVALLPTMGRTDSLKTYTLTVLQALPRELAQRTIGSASLPIVSVETLSPKPSDFNGTIAGHLNSEEIDFDDIRDTAAQANILQIRLRYYYRMTIPFANQMLQTLFFAQRGNAWALWSKTGLSATNPMLANGAEHNASRGRYVASARGQEPQAGTIVAAAYLHQYFFPLQATYSMRMQSNAYLSNIGGGQPSGPGPGSAP
jgi:hypothetical protein